MDHLGSLFAVITKEIGSDSIGSEYTHRAVHTRGSRCCDLAGRDAMHHPNHQWLLHMSRFRAYRAELSTTMVRTLALARLVIKALNDAPRRARRDQATKKPPPLPPLGRRLFFDAKANAQ